MNMNDLDKQPYDDEVQIVDLDDKRQSAFPFYRLIQRYGTIQPQVRSIFFSFALIASLLLLLFLVFPTLPQRSKPAPKSLPILQTNPQYLDVNITTNQTITFLHRADSRWLIARRNSDGQEIWRKEVFPGTSYLCSQQIEGEMIYCGTVNTDKLEFSAVHTTDGTILWNRQFEGEAYWTLTVIKNKNIYIADDAGNISAFNAQNGSLRWTWKTESSLELDRRLVFGDEAIAVLGINGHVDVLHTLSGKPICQYQSNENNWFPVFENGQLYAHTNHQSIQAFDLHTGRELWQYSSSSLTPWSVTAANNTVYAHENYTTIEALQGKNGQRLWRYQANGMMISPAVLQGHTLYIATQNATITALSTEKGELLWQKHLPLSAQLAALAVTGNTIYINLTLREGTLYALRTDNGQERWHSPIHHQYTSSPLLSGDGLYLEQDETHLEAKNAYDGALRWLQVLATPLVGNLQEDSSILYVRESSGLIGVIRSDDGKELWHVSLAQLI